MAIFILFSSSVWHAHCGGRRRAIFYWMRYSEALNFLRLYFHIRQCSETKKKHDFEISRRLTAQSSCNMMNSLTYQTSTNSGEKIGTKSQKTTFKLWTIVKKKIERKMSSMKKRSCENRHSINGQFFPCFSHWDQFHYRIILNEFQSEMIKMHLA